jgi:hypothetical protein
MPIAVSVVPVGIIDGVLDSKVTSNTIELLTWLAARPRTYTDTIDAWHTHCPRLSVWEDALIDGLIEVRRGGEPPRAHVVVTPRGRRALRA